VSDVVRGDAHPIEVTLLGGGRCLVKSGRVTSLAFAHATADGVWVCLEGRTWLISTRRDESTSRNHRDDFAALAAPMPATVIAVNVAPGDHVAAGTTMILLEAMKMELPIVAPRDGVVERLSCAVGELVQPGVILVELT
jgi:acetyl/propionyl-CoA carboxylase alpha subunit